MNTNIENIRLKNGEEYPVSPAYFDGTIVPFEADLSSAERATFSVAMGSDPIEMIGVKISDEIIQMETLRKYTYGKVNMPAPGEGELSRELHMMQIFENLQDMMEIYNPDFAALDIRSVPGYGVFLYPNVAVVMATEAGTFHDTLNVVTITFPSVGTYMVVLDGIPPAGTLSGELHFGEYHIPEGYLQISRAVEELYPTRWDTSGEELSLFTNPILYAAFNRAYLARKPIRLHMGVRTETYDYGGSGVWRGRVLYDSDSNELRREVVVFRRKEDLEVITTGPLSIDVDAEAYEEKTNGNLDKLTFTFDGTDWTLDGNVVALSDYGITLDGSSTEGDAFDAYLYGDSWRTYYEVICTIPQANGDSGATEEPQQ